MDIKQKAIQNWNKLADEFNQWDNLGGDEKEQLIINEAEIRIAELEMEAEDIKLFLNMQKEDVWDSHRIMIVIPDKYKITTINNAK